MSVLLHGEAGTGKTALAALLTESEFPLVRVISAAQMIGMGDLAQCDKIRQTFEEAY